MSLHILTVNTAITDRALSNWILSVSRFGYSYKVLGQGQKWGGWPWRTALYLKYIETLDSDDIVVLCDSGDLFFVLPPSELLSRFNNVTQREGARAVIGGESVCCNGEYYHDMSLRRYAINTITNYVNNDKVDGKQTSIYNYPNAGLVMGFVDRIRTILTDIIHENDDQAGYLSKYLANRHYIYVDNKQEIVGNVLRYNNAYNMCSSDLSLSNINECKPYINDYIDAINWIPVNNILDENIYIAYCNRLTSCIPAVLHFPGKAIAAYNAFGLCTIPLFKQLRKGSKKECICM